MSELGRAGYEAYARAEEASFGLGRWMPGWSDLSDSYKAAWAAAETAIVSARESEADDNINRSMTEKFGPDWRKHAEAEPESQAVFLPEVLQAFCASNEGDDMPESDRPAAGIMRHYSRLTDAAEELAEAVSVLSICMHDDSLVSDAARSVDRVQTLAIRLAGQAEWLRTQLEPQE